MDKKRFEITEYGSEYYIEIIDNEKELDESIDNPSQRLILVECADLLNELYEDNRQLKVLLQEAEDEIDRLKKSNKQWMESLVNMESED